jgi:cytochrome c oxidase subunit 2
VNAPALISTRHEFWSLFGWYAPIAAAVCLIVFATVLFAVLRYRKRPQAATWHENNPLEGAYAAFLVLVVAALLYLTYHHEHRVDTVANRQKPSLVIDVTAARWEWRFSYPKYGIVQHSGTVGSQPLVVPTHEPIRFNLSSIDVIHGFWIPELEYKWDVIPGAVQSVILTFTRTGVYASHCSVFCGLRHAEMVFNAKALTPTAFAAWVRSKTGQRS